MTGAISTLSIVLASERRREGTATTPPTEMASLSSTSPRLPPLSSSYPSSARRGLFPQAQLPVAIGGGGPLGASGWIRRRGAAVTCTVSSAPSPALRTCKNCKKQFDPALNHPTACRFHTAHFGGETKRKFESVYTGGTMDTPDSGKVLQYWHCCGSEDAFDPGCTAAPHASYDDL
ncbi:hypothetical protein Taro_041431 [Colocasia esculenta]|uniref:Uncharacterized protein n=1 Tax=Colocasia esculenta TaxID=4460 RepID=A0A843WTI8_COLES|nr:hypothetical protein [Colocasia esculenta]